MNLAMPVYLFALIRNDLAMGQYYHMARRENRKPAGPREAAPPRETTMVPDSAKPPWIERRAG